MIKGNLRGKQLKKSIILLIFLFILSVLVSGIAKAFAADYSGQPLPLPMRDKVSVQKVVNVSPYKDSNEKLYSTVGKSQLIKFDEPVKRISITDPSLADLVLLSPKELMLNGKKSGRTSLVFWGEAEKPIFFNLVVQQDTDAFIQAVNQIAPNENIQYSFTDDGLIMSGHISSTTVKKNIEEIVKAYNLKLLDLTESPTKQVLLEVKITEASRSFTRNFQSQFSVGQDAPNFLTNLGYTKLADLSNASFSNLGQYLYSSPSSNIAWAISAAETKGLVKILAEPKLLAIDGQPGSFNVGNEIPYPSSVAMSGTTAYTFKNTGVILNFTPTILEKSNRVILKLSPEVSEVDESLGTKYGTVGFKTRKVDTTVELADGETLIIAGLLSHNSSSSDTKIPWIGDIPVIGYLASSIKRSKNDTELVIFITPRIVEVDKNNSRMEL